MYIIKACYVRPGSLSHNARGADCSNIERGNAMSHKIKIKHNPKLAIGLRVSKIDKYDWDECWPLIENGEVTRVVFAFEQPPTDCELDKKLDYFVPVRKPSNT